MPCTASQGRRQQAYQGSQDALEHSPKDPGEDLASPTVHRATALVRGAPWLQGTDPGLTTGIVHRRMCGWHLCWEEWWGRLGVERAIS